MKKNQLLFISLALGSIVFLSSCYKTACKKQEQFDNEEAVVTMDSDYSTRIPIPIERPDGYLYNTKGTIEYVVNDEVVAKADFGDGTLDEFATVEKAGNLVKFDLQLLNSKEKLTKVITKPLVKLVGCDYIVEGTIDYYEGKKWVSTVDYGKGTCDEWATKKWSGGSKTFSLKKK